MRLDWCDVSGKVRYASKTEAQKYIGGIRRRSNFEKPLKVYRCESCGDFHLTKVTDFGVSDRKGKKKK